MYWRLGRHGAPNVRGSSVRKQLHVSILAHRILMWLLGFWKICKPLAIGHAICMYSIMAVSASCNIGIYETMSYSGHIHIFTGASLQFLLQIFVKVCLCTLFCRCCFLCMFSVKQSMLISNTFATYMWHGKNTDKSFVQIFHINSVYIIATYRIAMHVLKLSLQ
jgi:hypothetical protein